MRNSSLEKLKIFEMPKSTAKTVNGGVTPNPLADCIKTAIRDGNDFLISTCIDVLG